MLKTKQEIQRKKYTKTKTKHTHTHTQNQTELRKIREIEATSVQHDCRPFSGLTIAVIIILITLIYIDF